MAGEFELRPGDEVLLVRRRRVTTEKIDEDTGTSSPSVSVEDTTFAAVHVGDQMIVAGGHIEPAWEEDKHFLVVKLKAR
jgi:hypothetical protein